jgi:hypothetical protein
MTCANAIDDTIGELSLPRDFLGLPGEVHFSCRGGQPQTLPAVAAAAVAASTAQPAAQVGLVAKQPPVVAVSQPLVVVVVATAATF